MRFQMSMAKEMVKALEAETKKRKLETIQETMRSIFGEYFMINERKKEDYPKQQKTTVNKIASYNPLAH